MARDAESLTGQKKRRRISGLSPHLRACSLWVRPRWTNQDVEDRERVTTIPGGCKAVPGIHTSHRLLVD